jgi:hypothetical protein
MRGTVEEAMSQVVDWRGDLPPPMKEAIEQFRTQLGAAIDSVAGASSRAMTSSAMSSCTPRIYWMVWASFRWARGWRLKPA